MLCAKQLEFFHPVTGEKLVLESGMDAASSREVLRVLVDRQNASAADLPRYRC